MFSARSPPTDVDATMRATLHLNARRARVNAPATPSLYLIVAGMACVSSSVGTGSATIFIREFARGEKTLRRLSSQYVSPYLDRSIGFAPTIWRGARR